MSGASGIVVGMANQKEYPGYPRLYKKGDLVREASTPKDGVNLEHRGYTHVKEAEVDEKPADVKTEDTDSDKQPAGADAASTVAGKAEAPVTDAKPKLNLPGRPVRDNPQA